MTLTFQGHAAVYSNQIQNTKLYSTSRIKMPINVNSQSWMCSILTMIITRYTRRWVYDQCSSTDGAVAAETNNKRRQHAATVAYLQLQVHLGQRRHSRIFYLHHNLLEMWHINNHMYWCLYSTVQTTWCTIISIWLGSCYIPYLSNSISPRIPLHFTIQYSASTLNSYYLSVTSLISDFFKQL